MLICPQCGRSLQAENSQCVFCSSPLATFTDASNRPNSAVAGPDRIGDYSIEGQLACDGRGQILLGKRSDQQFVIKYLAASVGSRSEHLTTLFQAECETLSNLSHRGLPRITSCVADADSLHLVMPLPTGTTLFGFLYPKAAPYTRTPSGPLMLPDWDRVMRWSLQLVRVLCYLHEQRPFPVLHRALNPWSIYVLAGSEDLQLGDCGRLNAFRPAGSNASGSQDQPQDSFAIPWLEDGCWNDPRCDIYACGRVISFMLTGTWPTTTDGEPSTQSSSDARSSKESTMMQAIIERCCRDNSTQGYSRATELLADLEALGERAEEAAMRVLCSCGCDNRPSARLCQRCGQLLHAPVARTSTSSLSNLVTVAYDDRIENRVAEQYARGAFAPFMRFQLRAALDQVQSDPGFDELLSLDALPMVEKLPHQRQAAFTALKQMRGRALLADEVGLGKTIEAGIVLKELAMRGMASRILIFCPTQLLAQWQSEMYDKFDELFLVFGRDIDTSLAWHCPRLIAPYSVAQQRFHVEEMLRHRYDLVVLDEAHFLNISENERILQTVKSLQKKYFLLLSATPMHNSLEELYNIISLLRPGHFDDLASFKRRFIDPEQPNRPLNTGELRDSLHQVMIRNIRQQVLLEHPFPKRDATTVRLRMDDAGRRFFDDFRVFYRENLANVSNRRLLFKMGEMVERLCSSPSAFKAPMRHLRGDRQAQRNLGGEFIRRLDGFAGSCPDALVQPKVQAVRTLLQQQVTQGKQVLVFSQFNETAHYLYETISRADPDLQCFLYDEDQPLERRLRSLSDFRATRASVLFCPGEAGEGLNLQFVGIMINFDIPWDPMQLEQRIGRIQRIGGQKEIHIINLVLAETIEEDILRICEEKIKMFGDVIGFVEPILGSLREEDDFRAMMCDKFLDRYVEDDEGQRISPDEHLARALDEATQSATSVEGDPMQVIFDFSEPAEDEI